MRAKEWVPGKNQVPITKKEVQAKKLGEETIERLKEIVGEQSNTLRKIAGSSKNLHGTYVRLLRTAAESVEAVAIVMAERLERAGDEEKMLESNIFLMKKVRDLSEENEALRQTTEGSGEAMNTLTIQTAPPGACSTPRNRSLDNMSGVNVTEQAVKETGAAGGGGMVQKERREQKAKDNGGGELMMKRIGEMMEEKLRDLRKEMREIMGERKRRRERELRGRVRGKGSESERGGGRTRGGHPKPAPAMSTRGRARGREALLPPPPPPLTPRVSTPTAP